MKKMILIIALIFGFSINGMAQKVKKTTKVEITKVVLTNDQQIEQAKTDSEDVVKLLGLTDKDAYNFNQLFVMKYKTLNDSNATESDKKTMRSVVDAKIRASLKPAQMTILEKDKTLYNRLIN